MTGEGTARNERIAVARSIGITRREAPLVKMPKRYRAGIRPKPAFWKDVSVFRVAPALGNTKLVDIAFQGFRTCLNNQ
ncbi:MAG: hypothetical protein OXT74_03440 [Candidatus Poribacteria bacterium]|nr:hypothetical protein [Candidatus Poribacteria bacterium]